MKWILIVPLIILAVFAGLLILLLLTPASVRLKYISGVLNCRVKVYGIGLTVYPWKKRKAKKPKKTKEPKKQKKEKPAAAEQKAAVKAKEKSKKAKAEPVEQKAPDWLKSIDIEKLLEYAKFGISSAKRMLKNVKVNHFTLRCVIATEDAAKTAIAFGGASAAMSALLSVLDDTFNIKKQSISLDADFAASTTSIDVDIKVSTIAYKLAFSTLIIFIKFRKMMKKAVQS